MQLAPCIDLKAKLEPQFRKNLAELTLRRMEETQKILHQLVGGVIYPVSSANESLY